MKLFAPNYYTGFKCKADKCRHSCCIGWEIDVDSVAFEKYKSANIPYGKNVISSISEDSPGHFILGENGRCPHLDENGLCRIISEMGEGYLCDICREHPRFYNDTALGRETGIGMSCEAACEIILKSDSYTDMIPLGNLRGKTEKRAYNAPATRQKLYSVLSDRTIPYLQRLLTVAERYGISPSTKSDSEWREVLARLEYLNEAHKELFSYYTSHPQTVKSLDEPLEKSLAYFVYRHCAEAESEEEHRVAVGLCLMLERLLASLAAKHSVTDTQGLCELARILSEEIEYSEDNLEALKEELLF